MKFRSVPVCMFHHVNENAGDFLTVSVPVFAEMMARLHQEGYATLSSEEFREYMLGLRDVPPKSVLLTFDDAWLDVFVRAFPILCEFGHKFTVFVISDCADMATAHPRETVPEAFLAHREAEKVMHMSRAGEVMCSWDDLREMARSGLCSVENHTAGHGRLDDIGADIALGRDALRHRLGRAGNQLCWPSGRHDAKSLAVARALGIEITYLVRRGVNLAGHGAMRVKRFTVDDRDGDWLMRQLEIFSRPVYGYFYSRIKPDRLKEKWLNKWGLQGKVPLCKRTQSTYEHPPDPSL
jgi:peptidoglycan/xylan/chitin deacetylase (PgdA/CDA1 family)